MCGCAFVPWECGEGGEGDGGVAFGLGDEQAGYNVMASDDLQDVVLPLLAVHLVRQHVISHEGGSECGAHDLRGPPFLPALVY